MNQNIVAGTNECEQQLKAAGLLCNGGFKSELKADVPHPVGWKQRRDVGISFHNIFSELLLRSSSV